VAGSEIIGMIPMDTLVRTMNFYLGVDDFGAERVIENRLLDELSRS